MYQASALSQFYSIEKCLNAHCSINNHIIIGWECWTLTFYLFKSFSPTLSLQEGLQGDRMYNSLMGASDQLREAFCCDQVR